MTATLNEHPDTQKKAVKQRPDRFAIDAFLMQHYQVDVDTRWISVPALKSHYLLGLPCDAQTAGIAQPWLSCGNHA